MSISTSTCSPSDFPPIPACFSHLVAADGFPQGIAQSPNNFNFNSTSLPRKTIENETFVVERYKPTKERDQNTDLENECDPKTTLKIESRNDRRERNNFQALSSKATFSDSDTDTLSCSYNGMTISENNSSTVLTEEDFGDPKNLVTNRPFSKLNSSLTKLHQEMRDLRHLDVSLFCQLFSLHEAIQDFKTSIADRCSETGSEYSLGTASYMGSMSSLVDESDWVEENTLAQSPQNSDSHQDFDDNTYNVNRQSASSLLEQINALVQRADEDF